MTLLTILIAGTIFAIFCLISPKRWWGQIEINENDDSK